MENNIKTLLIASFVQKTKMEWFLGNLEDNFGINKKSVFIYEIEDNISENLLTFKIKKDKKVNLKLHFENATVVNIKNCCIFSINGLNKLIEFENCENKGNIIHEKYIIDWSKYKNRLILSKKDKIVIKNIKKISDKVEKKR